MKNEKILMPKEELIRLKNVLKQYRNVYKTLYLTNPTAAEEFLQKQEAYFKKKDWSESHLKNLLIVKKYLNKILKYIFQKIK